MSTRTHRRKVNQDLRDMMAARRRTATARKTYLRKRLQPEIRRLWLAEGKDVSDVRDFVEV